MCTAWAHGIHPQKLSYFDEELWKCIEELGLGDRRGLGREIGEKEGGNDKGNGGLGELEEGFIEENGEKEPEAGNGESEERGLVFKARFPEWDRDSGRGSSKWTMMRDFFYDLADYWTDSEVFEKSNFWAKVQKGLSEGRVVKKNGSYFRSDAFSWDKVR